MKRLLNKLSNVQQVFHLDIETQCCAIQSDVHIIGLSFKAAEAINWRANIAQQCSSSLVKQPINMRAFTNNANKIIILGDAGQQRW